MSYIWKNQNDSILPAYIRHTPNRRHRVDIFALMDIGYQTLLKNLFCIRYFKYKNLGSKNGENTDTIQKILNFEVMPDIFMTRYAP